MCGFISAGIRNQILPQIGSPFENVIEGLWGDGSPSCQVSSVTRALILVNLKLVKNMQLISSWLLKSITSHISLQNVPCTQCLTQGMFLSQGSVCVFVCVRAHTRTCMHTRVPGRATQTCTFPSQNFNPFETVKQVQTGSVTRGESHQIMRKCCLGSRRPTCSPMSATEDECASGQLFSFVCEIKGLD